MRLTSAKAASHRPRSPGSLEDALDSLQEGVQIIGFDWTYLYVNAAVARHGRRTPQELVGRRVTEVFPGIQRTPLFRTLRRCMTQRIAARTQTKFTFPDGSHRFFDLSIAPASEGLLVLSIDITDKKFAQEKLARTVALLERAQKIAHVGSYELKLDKQGAWFDEAFRINGLKLGDRLRLRNYLSRVVHPADREHVKKLLLRAFEHRSRYEAEYRIVRPNGAVRFMHSVAEPRPVKNGEISYLGALQDVTERRKLEREVLKTGDDEKRRIGQDLHDGLCQHLAGIEFRLVELTYAAGKQSQHCATELRKIAEMVRNAIAQTRSIAHGLSPVPMGGNGLKRALEQLAATTKENFNISCEFTCPESVEIQDNVIATHLYRIAQEAVQNSIRHGKPKRVDMNLLRAADRVILGVRDDGVGVPGRRRKGTGIGIRLMQYRASLVHGSLVVHHPSSGGTEVVCSLHCPRLPAPLVATNAKKSK